VRLPAPSSLPEGVRVRAGMVGWSGEAGVVACVPRAGERGWVVRMGFVSQGRVEPRVAVV